MKGISLFSSAGIAETYFEKANIDIIVASELLPKRAEFYQKMYPKTKMITGDITDKNIKKQILDSITSDVKFLLATPPCQGFSNLGKNKNATEKINDLRNHLIFDVLEIVDKHDFDYIMIENVPGFLKLKYEYEGKELNIEELLNLKYSKNYIIDVRVLNAKDYGVPQSRPRAIIKMFKKNLKWPWPKEQKEITLEKAIGQLPSIESGEDSGILHHHSRKHTSNHILWMSHTPTGCSALGNEEYYPKKKDGSKIKAFKSTYKRMKWDSPAPAVTMRNDAISSQENVHPGRKQKDGTYSDARVLSLLELLIVSSLPKKWKIPKGYSDIFIRNVIGEAIPPKLALEIVSKIGGE